jgi:hypothetical protein
MRGKRRGEDMENCAFSVEITENEKGMEFKIFRNVS